MLWHNMNTAKIQILHIKSKVPNLVRYDTLSFLKYHCIVGLNGVNGWIGERFTLRAGGFLAKRPTTLATKNHLSTFVSFKCPLFMEITCPSSSLTFWRYLRFWWFAGSNRVLYECSSDWHLAGFREMTHSLLGLLNQNWRWFKCVEPWGVLDWLFDSSWVSGFGSRPWNFCQPFWTRE